MTCDNCPYLHKCTHQCMDLPEGMTCADCANVEWCTMAYGVKPSDKKCGFEPIRFRVRKEKA